MINTTTEFSKRQLKIETYSDLKEKSQGEERENKAIEQTNLSKSEVKFRYPKNGLYGLL